MPKRLAILSLLAMAQAWLCAEDALAHGFWIYRQDDTIQTFSQNSTVLDDRLYNASLGASLQTASSVEILVGSGLEAPGDVFSIRLFGPLWYSTGEAATRADADVVLAVDSYSDRFQTNLLGATIRTSASNSIIDLPVPGDDHDSIYWTLGGDSLPEGVYGVSYIVRVLKGGDPMALLESDPLVISFRTPAFDAGPETLADARLAVFAAATVPEPSGIVLAVFGVIAACYVVRRSGCRPCLSQLREMKGNTPLTPTRPALVAGQSETPSC